MMVSDPEAGEPPREADRKTAATPEKNAAKDRLAAALRENLRRRKTQRRGRSAAVSEPTDRMREGNDRKSGSPSKSGNYAEPLRSEGMPPSDEIET